MQMVMHRKEFSRISENMVSNVLIHGNDIGQDRPLQNTASVIAESDDHDHILMAAQRPGTPVLPGAAVITVEEINIS